jgi:hypothetical protein
VFTGIGKAAWNLGLGQHVVRLGVARGDLPTVFGQRKRVKVSDVRAWIESHRKGR